MKKITTLKKFHEAVLDAVKDGFVKNGTSVFATSEMVKYSHIAAPVTKYRASILDHPVMGAPVKQFSGESPEAVIFLINALYKEKSFIPTTDISI